MVISVDPDASEPFKDFRDHAQTFYVNVRCGMTEEATPKPDLFSNCASPGMEPTAPMTFECRGRCLAVSRPTHCAA